MVMAVILRTVVDTYRKKIDTMKWILWPALTLATVILLIWIVGAILPKSHSVSRSLRVNQPPVSVWPVIIGPPNWRPDIKAYQELPPHDGHRMWSETDKNANTVTYEETEAGLVPGSSPVWRRVTRIADPKLPFGGTWTIEVTPAEDGSIVTITENGEVYNAFFRFASRFIIGHSATIDAYMNALRVKLS